MKTLKLLSFLLLLTVLNLPAQTAVSGGNTKQTPVPAPTAYHIVDQGANHNVWRRETYEAGPNGQVITHEHQYTELASGLNFFDSNSQQWLPSKEEIDILPQGGASAIQGQHQAYFPGDIYSGVIELVTAEGIHLKSRPVGLSYDDGTNSILIAQLTNSTGYLVGSNQIIYPDAFVGVSADLRYTYTKGGFEQDVILKEQPPTPGSLGLNADSTRLQVLTEFFNPPKPTVTATLTQTDIGEATDDQLSFGGMRMGHGKAFLLGTDPTGVMVNKQWVQIQGRQILVEEVPTASIAKDLEALPLSKVQVTSAGKTHPLARCLILPAQHLAKARTPVKIQLARNDSMNRAGLVLDYQTIGSSLTNYTFRGDLTYYVSGTTVLWGTNTFEGGTVIKYANSAGAMLSFNPSEGPLGPLICQTGPYRPAIFTSMNDNSIGEPITGSTGNPTNTSATYLYNPDYGDFPQLPLQHLRFHFAGTAIYQGNTDALIPIKDCQFIQCSTAIKDLGLTIFNPTVQQLYNVLVTKCGEGISDNPGCNFIVDGENLTIDQTSIFLDGGSDSLSGTFTNCVFTGVSYLSYAPGGSGTITLFDCVQTNTLDIYESVGGANYYLVTNSIYRNAGTTNINSSLLADLASKTTYPPIVYSNTTISVATTFSPQAQRDTDTPDLGYHYDPIDYAVGGLDLYAAITVNAGTAIGWFDHTGPVYSGQPYGMSLNNGASLTFQGTATQPCWMSRFDMAQENSAALPWRGWMGGVMFNGSSMIPQLNARFTKWSLPANNNNQFRDNWDYGMGTFSDCEFYYGSFGAYNIQSLTFTNCLFYRDALYFYDQDRAINFDFQNCTFYNGFFEAARYSYDAASQWVVHDTAFDGTGFSLDDNFAGNPSYTSFDHNAYTTNNLAGLSYPYPYTPQPTNVLEDIGAHDLFIGGFDWQTGLLGDFYLPTNSPLINKGSTTADQVGLYHFTSQTNQMIEADTIVDIGYHYVGMDCGGIDTIWVDDAIPAGAGPYSDGGDFWTWVSSGPTPFSGQLASQSGIISGEHQHYFQSAANTLKVNTGDTLIAYVYLDAANPPSEIMLQWNNGDWNSRAYWGANDIPWGTDGTVSRVYMGTLPPTGQWVRLEIPASVVGLEGQTLNGMAFTLYDGRATWDYAGKNGETFCFDTDGDGIPDYIEDSNGNGIFDTGDLSNWQLFSTDGTGMNDGWEIKYFGHVGIDLDADADGDGLSNGEEYRYGSNPTNADENQNGVLDGSDDWDGDLLNNISEIRIYGTDPRNANSVSSVVNDSIFKLAAEEVPAGQQSPTELQLNYSVVNGNYTVTMSGGTPGVKYEFLRCFIPLTGPWTQWQVWFSEVAPANGIITKTIPAEPPPGYIGQIDVAGVGEDSDHDGLSDVYELYVTHTSPNNWDSSVPPNGISDGMEDPDGDGFSNLVEYHLGTDPNSPDPNAYGDTDGDGLADEMEAAFGGNPTVADPGWNQEDSGGDGLPETYQAYLSTVGLQDNPTPNLPGYSLCPVQ